LTDHAKDAALRGEYTRQDRYWRVIYYTYRQFKSHYDACINRILDASEHGNDLQNHRPSFTTPQAIPLQEPPEELKERVKSRDGFRCLCCGYGKQRIQLQVDHISPSYHGGNHYFDNLQTLCKTCNNAKGIEKISFRNNQTTLTTAPFRLPMLKTPVGSHAKEPEWWEIYIRRTINLFFRCAAVDSVEIGGRGKGFRR
jgi:5-methylcytosine-specific restriction endonuclease McrA